MPRYIILISLISLGVSASATVSFAKRMALVIGNDRYIHFSKQDQLERARNDARSVGRELARLGFQVHEGYDLTRRKMHRRLFRFARKVSPGDEVVFFYAGHGVGIGGRNYLLPSDTPRLASDEEQQLKSEVMQLDTILEAFKKRGARIAILILDACRDNPFVSLKKRSVARNQGLSAPDKLSEGVMILFSAGVGQKALDSLSPKLPDTEKNSVFTRALLPLLKEKDLEIKNLANKVRRDVYFLAKKVGHNQRPASYDDIISDYYLSKSGQRTVKQVQPVVVRKETPKPEKKKPVVQSPPKIRREVKLELSQKDMREMLLRMSFFGRFLERIETRQPQVYSRVRKTTPFRTEQY